MPELTAEPRHQSGGLAVALAKLNLDAPDRRRRGRRCRRHRRRNVTTAIRADIKELAGSIQSLHREVATLRWMIGIGFTLLSIFLALSTFLRSNGT